MLGRKISISPGFIFADMLCANAAENELHSFSSESSNEPKSQSMIQATLPPGNEAEAPFAIPVTMSRQPCLALRTASKRGESADR